MAVKCTKPVHTKVDCARPTNTTCEKKVYKSYACDERVKARVKGGCVKIVKTPVGCHVEFKTTCTEERTSSKA